MRRRVPPLPGPQAPAPRQLRPAAPHRYRGGSTGTAPQAASAATLRSGRYPSITNLPPSHSLPAPQAGHRPSAEHAGSGSPKPPPSPPSCEAVLRRSNYSSQEPQRRKDRWWASTVKYYTYSSRCSGSCPGLSGAGRGGGDPFRFLGLPLAPEDGPQVEAASGSSPRRRWWPFWETGFLFGRRCSRRGRRPYVCSVLQRLSRHGV